MLGILREDEVIPFKLYLVLTANKRIILFRRDEDTIEQGFKDIYAGKGLTVFYVPVADEQKYVAYIKSLQDKKDEDVAIEVLANLEKKDPTYEAPFEKDPEVETPPPEEVTVTEEQNIKLQESFKNLDSKDENKRKEGETQAQELIEAIVLEGENKKSLFTELWQDSKKDELQGHAINIATYACVFGLGMGLISRDTLKNLAMAGLLHDLGVSQIDSDVVRIPQEKRTPRENLEFHQHLQFTLEMILPLKMALSPELLKALGGHHEKFDGTGYPKHIKTFALENICQILSMADIFDGMIRGHYDGVKRTLTEAFQTIVKIEKSKIFPQYYNPDLFNKLVKWVETNADTKILEEADNIVQETVSAGVGHKAA